MRTVQRLVNVMVLVAFGGCGGSPPAPPTPVAKPTTGRPAKPSINTASAEAIGPLGDAMPPLDGGRLELARPQDWVAAARDKKFVAQFTAKQGAAYPRIMVTAESAEGSEELTAKNVKAFAKEVQNQFETLANNDEDGERAAGDDDPSYTAIPPVTPLKLGDRYWVETTRKAFAKFKELERLILVTVIDGRRYTVELRSLSGSPQSYRPQALAVASSLKPLNLQGDPAAGLEPTSPPNADDKSLGSQGAAE